MISPVSSVTAAPRELPVDQAQAVHVGHLPAVEHRLVNGLVKQLGGHVALGAHLVVVWDVDLAGVEKPEEKILNIDERLIASTKYIISLTFFLFPFKVATEGKLNKIYPAETFLLSDKSLT